MVQIFPLISCPSVSINSHFSPVPEDIGGIFLPIFNLQLFHRHSGCWKKWLALWGKKGLDNLGQNPLKGLFMWRCALRGRNRGKAAAYRHLLILMELSETICQQQGLVLNILLEGRWKCLLFFFLFVWKGGSSSNRENNIAAFQHMHRIWIRMSLHLLNKRGNYSLNRIECLKAQ